MKNLRAMLALLALCAPARSWAATAHDFFPICTAPPASAAHTLIVDPSSGKPGALPNIAAALKMAKPGDAIDLMTGDYGDLNVAGTNQGGFITIEAAAGQTPRFSHITVGRGGGASHWRLNGLSVSSYSNGRWANGAVAHTGLIIVNSSDNIILEHNKVYTQDGDMAWQTEDNAAAANKTVSDGIGVDQSSCVTLSENRMFNVWGGLNIGGDQTDNRGKYFLVSGNMIDNFAADGIDHSVSHARILGNHITNGHDICENKCIHTDGIQGWNWHNKPGLVNTDVIISDNEIVVQTKPGLVLPADDLHGITIFDGSWNGVQIINNVIVTDTWHGISIYGATNLQIVNNTIAPTNPSRRTWIKAGRGKSDPPDMAYSILIRNNVTPEMPVTGRDAPPSGSIIDHNLILKNADDFADAFIKFDPEHFAYDLHPSKKSDAKGEGSADGAPAIDVEGLPRKAKIDIGAYAYQGN